MCFGPLLLVFVLAGQTASATPPALVPVDPTPSFQGSSTAQSERRSSWTAPNVGEATRLDGVPVQLPSAEMRDLPRRPTEVDSTPRNTMASELVSRALETPKEGKLTGLPLSLLESLALVRDGSQQLAVVQAYWKLATAVAQYYVRYRQGSILDRMEAQSGDELRMRSARVSAAASLDEAKITVVIAQHDLAVQALLSPDSDNLPLPSDRPYVGPYSTRYEQIFLLRPAPPSAQLIRRTLPLRQQAIEARARAVQTAQQAFSASQNAYRQGSTNLQSILDALAVWARQEHALMRSVGDFNRDIAEYATAALVSPTDPTTLVSMLIGRPIMPNPEGPVPVAGPSRIDHLPARAEPWNQPVPILPRSPIQPVGNLEPIRGRPTLPPSELGRLHPVPDVTPNEPFGDEMLVPVEPLNEVGMPDNRPNDSPAVEPASGTTDAPKLPVIPANDE